MSRIAKRLWWSPLYLGLAALSALALVHWLLIALATAGLFHYWAIALPVLVLAGAGALVTGWRLRAVDRLAAAIILGVTALLYLPPAEELALTGDAAIYVNEGIFVARTGGLRAVHEPLAALPPATRTLFYTTAAEQFPTQALDAYAGILYRGYYVADAATATIETSRMPLSTVWFAFIYALAGGQQSGAQALLYSTPCFALLSLLLLYAIARRLVDWPLALAATVLLALSYPQIYFGRLSYAEIFGQCWTLASVLTALLWIDGRRPALLLLALFFAVTTWAGRIDALLLLPALYLLLIYAALAHDRRSLTAVALGLPVLAALVVLSVNRAYAGATLAIQLWRWPWFGGALMGLLVLGPLSTAVAWRWGRPIQTVLLRLRPLLHRLGFGALAFIILWATLPNPLREPGVTKRYQEIIWLSSAYLTPLFYWLALAGVARLLFGGYDAKRFWLLLTFYSLGTVFFYNYTSAPVYPVSLRRLTSDLLPLMTILIATALAPLSHLGQSALAARLARLWQGGRWVLIAVVIGWMALLSRPLWPIREGAGTLAVLHEIHTALPANSVILFEDQDSDSWVGWLAAPLYALYGDRTLLFDGDTPDPQRLREALDALQAQGWQVSLVTQQPAAPTALVPTGYQANFVQEFVWASSLIGQTAAPYPPPIWHYRFPIRIYALTKE
jgi:hypothetical protein